jgi:predicted deacetylase
MYAIVEIHDVSPFYKQEVYQAVEFLQRLRIDKFSLLVIPNYMEEYPLYKHMDFVGFLKALEQEIVLHGYSHKAKVKLSQILYTYGEGEFGEGGIEETYQKIEKALDIFESLSLTAKFFVPPAWISNPWMEDVLSAFGFRAVGYRDLIKDLQSEEKIPSPSITFSNRPVLSFLSLMAVPAFLKLYKKAKVLRLSLHTRDFRDRRKIVLWRSILREVKKEREVISYEELFSKSRPAPSLQGV